MGVNKYNVKIGFLWDNHSDIDEFLILVPNNVTIAEIKEALIGMHKYLDIGDKTNIYEKNGRTPETLLNYVCMRHDWHWEPLVFDINVYLD